MICGQRASALLWILLIQLIKLLQDSAAKSPRLKSGTVGFLTPLHTKLRNLTLDESVDWKAQARTHLFRSKRCEKLATLLGIRMTFNAVGFNKPTKACLQKALLRSDFLAAVRTLVRMIKADHIGVDMMDITVCGAVAPYNALLGGKLICMLLTSPEVTQY